MLDMALVLKPMALVMALEIGISYIDLAFRSMPLLLLPHPTPEAS